MAQVVIAEFMNQSAVADLEEDFEVLYDPSLAETRDRLLREVRDATALVVRNRTRVDAALLAEAPALRLVARLGVGLDNIDLEECSVRDVQVSPAIGANATAVAEYVIAALFQLIRPVFDQSEEVIDGNWPRRRMFGGELSGRRLGLLGYGSIAREVANRARALGMRVGAHDPFVSPDDPVWGDTSVLGLDDLFETSQALSIHVPLAHETEGMVDEARLQAMPRGSVLVNTSRGGIVDETALVAALADGHLAGAALDVFAREPLDAVSGERFRGVPNLLLTPHIAGITVESDERVGAITAAAVREVLEQPA